MKKNASLIILIIGFLCSCSKEIENLLDLNRIEFVLGDSNGSIFSGADSGLENDFSTGVFVNEVLSSPLSGLLEIPVVNNMPFLNSNGVLMGDKLYLDKNKRYNIRAYAPFVAGIKSNRLAIPFEHGTDVIWASSYYSADVQGTIINQVKLEYTHLVSKAGFILTDERDSISKQSFDFRKATFSISGFCRRFFLNLNSGEITLSEIDHSVTITKQNTSICFATKPVSSNYEITIEIPPVLSLSSSPQIIKSNFTYNFCPGHSYLITIGVNTKGINLTGDIVNWETQLSDNLELESK